MVRTSPFHGGNRGSNPLGVTNNPEDFFFGIFLFGMVYEFLDIKSVKYLHSGNRGSAKHPLENPLGVTNNPEDFFFGIFLFGMVCEEKPTGIYEAEFNSAKTRQDLSLFSEVYFCKLQKGDFVQTMKMILNK